MKKGKKNTIEEVFLNPNKYKPKIKKTGIGIYEIKILTIPQSFEMTSTGKVLNHKFIK